MKEQAKPTINSRKAQLARKNAVLTRAKKEIFKRGAKHLRPLALARRKVLVLTSFILVGLALLFLVAMSVLIYVYKEDNALVYNTARILAFPAARVNGDWVSYSDYLFEVRYRRNVYENPSGPASSSNQALDLDAPENAELLDEIQNSSMERAKSKVIIRQLAKEYDVVISSKDLDAAARAFIDQQGGDQKFQAAIQNSYGWSMVDFRREYYLSLLTQKLQVEVLPPLNPDQRAKAEEILKQLQNGENFAALAKQHSDDSSRDGGGDLGFVSASTPFVEEFKAVALNLEPGQLSGVVATQFGFHIIKATEKRDSEVRVSHILVRYGQDMETVLAERLAQAKVNDFIKLPEVKGADNGAG